MRTINRIVLIVHSTLPAEAGWPEVDAEARKKGYLRGQYNYLVKRDGTVQEGRSHELPPICPDGNSSEVLAVGAIVPKGQAFTDAQKHAADALLHALNRDYPEARIGGMLGA